jgi:hypothetical protein
MTRDGGFYYRSILFRYLFTYTIIVPVATVVLIALINPFWFRDIFFHWIENTINQIVRWRNYQQYRLYLGTDPVLWHTLKNDLRQSEGESVQASP